MLGDNWWDNPATKMADIPVKLNTEISLQTLIQ
jgi:hypothetical protein